MVLAQAAAQSGEVPVGAVVVLDGQIIGVGQNAPIHTHDPSAHAEMVALRQAAKHLGNYRLDACELFVTLEPCAMCAGAMLHARLKRVVFGAFDPKTGAAGSVLNLFAQPQLNHQTSVEGGLMEQSCGALLQQFFRQQRQQKAAATWPIREDALRTPASCFNYLHDLPGVSVFVNDLQSLQGLRLHYVDKGVADAATVYLCLHGSKAWSIQWRSFSAEQAAMGARVLAIDLIGFGLSDKPKKPGWHSLERHARIVEEWLRQLNLYRLILVEPPEGSLSDRTTGESLATALMTTCWDRILERQLVPPDTLTQQVLAAPYPDTGHQAAWRAFQRNELP
jgi:tRNA(adenine34) deaminase